MNKKFLSAILFGALMVTSTGTFVSCKDYDDDIDSLQEQIDQKASLTEMQSQISSLQSALNECKTTCASNLATAKAQLEAAIKAADDAAKEAAAKVVAEQEARIAAIEALQKQLNDFEDEVNAAIKSAAEKNDAAIEALQKEFAALKNEVNALVDKRLSGLVLNPDFYYSGIEAIGVKSITYTELKLAEVNADADNSKDAPTSLSAVEVTPVMTAKYHMNPSTADLTGYTKDQFKFLVEDKAARAATVKPEVTDWDTEDGDLIVSAKLTEGTIKNIAKDQQVTVVALEVTTDVENEVAVTSDYAAVYAETITGFALDNAATVNVDDHLATTAAKAIEAAPIVKVAWDATVNLADYVETHITVDNACKTWDGIETANFGYKYELVGWFDGKNNTSQSAHAALDGSILRPQLPSDGKAAAYATTEQSQATIGRMPLVRVSLLDKNSATPKVVAVGYILVEITATPGKNTISAEVEYTFNEAFTLSCNTGTINHLVKWYQIEEEILTQLKISKAEFDNNYVFELKDGDSERGNLYSYNGEEYKLANLANNEIAVREATDELEGTTTEVLKMSVNAGYAYEYFLSGKTSMSAIVRYAKETGIDALGNQTYDYVYVTLKWAPSPLNVNPTGTIADADKIKQYWFADDNAEGGSGYNEIHVNVNVPGEDAVTTKNFKKNMLETFVDGDITITGVDEVYADFQDLTTELVFAKPQSTSPITGVSGTKYYLVPNADGKFLRAYTSEEDAKNLTSAFQAIAQIADGEIVYINTNAAKDILNAAGRDDLANNVTATVMVKETNACGKSLNELTNNTFDVKFLRPITVKQGEMGSFKDGVDVGATGSKVALKLEFTDWRGYSFVTTPYDYYKHYGIESIEYVESEITTNVTGSWGKLQDGMKVDYTAAATIGKDGDFGTLTYINNNAEVGNFSIKVPFVVNYVWGQIKFVVEVNVEKTVG